MIEVQMMGVAVAAAEVPASLADHFDLVWLVLIAALIAIVWFAKRAFNEVCANQKDLWGRFDDHEHRLSTIEGEHHIAMTGGKHS